MMINNRKRVLPNNMSKKLREAHIKQPPRMKDESRVSNPSHGPAVCVRCRNLYDKRSWKYPTQRAWGELSEKRKRKLLFVLCPACKMEKEHLFEGEIVIEHIPKQYFFDLIRLIYRFAEREEGRSPEHRLIGIEGNEKKMTVKTTENQLAGKLAKKIKQSFKGHAFIAIEFSREPYATEFVRVNFSAKSANDAARRNSS